MESTRITADFVRAFAQDLLAAADALAEKHGLTVKGKSNRYDPLGGYFTSSLEFTAKTTDGVVHGRDAAAYKECAALFGLGSVPLGARVVLNREEFTVVGLKPRSRMPVIVARVSDGKRFKFGADAVTRAFEAGRDGHATAGR